jgi:hypothetical protein
MDTETRARFLFVVRQTVKENPGIVRDLQMAIQGGILERLEQEQDTATKLAYAFSWVWSKTPEKKLESLRQQITPGVTALQQVFDGSQHGNDLKAWLEKGDK